MFVMLKSDGTEVDSRPAAPSRGERCPHSGGAAREKSLLKISLRQHFRYYVTAKLGGKGPSPGRGGSS